MKRFALVIALLCEYAVTPAWGAMVPTGTPFGGGCASATTCAATYSPTAANGVLVFLQTNGTATISSVTDNASGGSSTYTSLFNGACNTSGSTYNCGLFFACNVKAGVTTITGNFSVADPGAIIVSEYTNPKASGCGDQASSAATGNGAAQTAGTTGTTTQASELVVGAFLADGGNTFANGTGGYTHRKSANCSVCGSEIGITDQSVSATGTYAATASTGVSVTWNGHTATIKAASSFAPPQRIIRF